MMKMMKRIGFFIVIGILFLAGTIVVYGTESDEVKDEEIRSVSITVSAQVRAGESGGELYANISSTRYTIDGIEFTNDSGEWKIGQIPQAVIVVTAEDGYYFGQRISGSISVKGSGAEFSSYRVLNNGEAIEINIRLKEVEGALGEIEEAYWVIDPLGKAKWDNADFARAYEIQLYRGSTMIKKIERTTTNDYNLYPYMNKEGDYSFRVRAVPNSAHESSYTEYGPWQYSNNLYISYDKIYNGTDPQDSTSPEELPSQATEHATPVQPVVGHWVKEAIGWWYQRADGTYPTYQWEMIGGVWYFFGHDGYMDTGWLDWSGQTYYLTSNGDMITGWFQDNRKWYYFDQSGAMQRNWIDAGTNRYFMNSDGVAVVGWNQVGSSWYYFYPDTAIMARDAIIGGYYVNAEGILQ